MLLWPQGSAAAVFAPGGRTWFPTRDERFQVLKQLDEEVGNLTRTYLRRKTKKGRSTVAEVQAPDGYESYLDYQLMGIVDRIFVPGCCAEYLDIVNGLIRRREQLRTYAARRSGTPLNRYQNPKEWETWSHGDPLPRLCGVERESAKGYFREGEDYEKTLWLVTNNWMLLDGEQLDRRRAVAIKKCVDRAYVDILNKKPPSPPRGWWRPEPGLVIGRDGVRDMGLAWVPRTNTIPQSNEPIIPHHLRVQWMVAFSCWKDGAEQWP